MEGSGSIQIVTDPDPRVQKSYGSGILVLALSDLVLYHNYIAV
jgi:hypothetical protein